MLHPWAGGPCYVVGQVGRVMSLGRWAVLRRWAGGPCYVVGQVGRGTSFLANIVFFLCRFSEDLN